MRWLRLAALASHVAATIVAAALCFPLSAAGVPDRTVVLPAEQTGRVVVGFEPGCSASVSAATRAEGAMARGASARGRFLVVAPRQGQTPAALSRALAGKAGVRYAQPERTVHALMTPTDPDFPQQTNLMNIRMPSAWGVTFGDPNVKIAVLDSGAYLEHEDLVGRLDTANDYDFIDLDTSAEDEFGHGTHVAGILGAATNNGKDIAGIAFGCPLLPVRVLDEYGAGSDTEVADGVYYAVNHGATVINMSLGMIDRTRVLEDAIEYAIAHDVVIVAAAGNFLPGETPSPGLDYPAAFPDVIAVGAVGADDVLSRLSQYGQGLDLVAPGENVLSLTPPFANSYPVGMLSGTSVAAPHVAGVAALLRSQNPTWTAALVAERLSATAQDLGVAGYDTYYGYGLVRADLALGVGSAVTLPSDDSIPGVPVSTQYIGGFVDASSDPRDVYGVALSEGHTLRLTITGSVGATISASLLGPDAVTLAGAVPLATAVSTGGAASFSYRVPAGDAGTYRIVVTAIAGSGPYAVSWLRGYETAVSAAAPSSCAWGGQTIVHGKVSTRGEPLPYVRVILDARPQTSSRWTYGVSSAKTDVNGIYRFTVRPSRRMAYRVRFTGIPGELSSTSLTAKVSPLAALSAPLPTSAARPNARFTLAGNLRPEYPAGGRTVKLTVYRWYSGSGKWVRYSTFYAYNLDWTGYTRYVRSLSLPKGRWSVVASVAEDYWHAYTSAVTRFTLL